MNIGAAMQNLFGGGKSPNAATAGPPVNPNQQPQNERQRQEQAARGTTPDGVNTQLENADAGGEDADGKGKVVNPLDKFSKMWDNPLGPDGKPVQPKQGTNFNLDPAKIAEFAAKQDFKKFVKPETMAAIAKGGEEGSAAFAQAIQDIGSNTFSMAMTASSNLTQKALKSQMEQFEASLPELVKKLSSKDSLRSKNPAFSHPAAQPILEAITERIAKHNPDATASEHQEMAEEFFTSFAESFGKKPKSDDSEPGNTGKRKKNDEDWSQFLP